MCIRDRNYMMERFLERVSLSQFRENFILKGGMLVAAMVGLDTRSTLSLIHISVPADGSPSGSRG